MMDNRKAVIDLLLVSALGLFVELVFIRWVASELRVLAFYKNFALIAAFLGLGLGFVVRHNNPERRLFERYFFPLLSFSVIVILVLGRTTLSELIILNRSNTQEFLWAATLNVNDPIVEAILSIAFYAILWLLFVLFTVLFIPLGELTARKFAAFKPLKGYTINVVGSLTGILIYTLISFLAWPPSAWFLMIAVTGLLMLPRDNSWLWRGQFVLAVFPIALTMFWPTGAERTLWSPYYRVRSRTSIRPKCTGCTSWLRVVGKPGLASTYS